MRADSDLMILGMFLAGVVLLHNVTAGGSADEALADVLVALGHGTDIAGAGVAVSQTSVLFVFQT